MSSRPLGKRVSRPALVTARLATLLLLVVASACGRSDVSLSLLPTDAVVLAFGDSLTAGIGAPSAKSYPAVLASLTGMEVIRAGVPGEVTADGLERLPRVLDTHQPDLLLLCHGGNDMLRRRGSEQMERNLRTMIDLARDRGVAVVLIGVPEPGLFLSTAPVYERISADLGVPLEMEALAEILGDRGLRSDAIHPNAAGYQQLAERVAELLRRAGAI